MSMANKDVTKHEFRIAARNYVIFSCILILCGVLTIIAAYMWEIHCFWLGLCEIIVGFFILAAGLYSIRERQFKFLEYLNQFSFCLENTTKTAVLNFPQAMVVTSVDGAILWYNSGFSKMVGRENLYDEYLQDCIKNFQISRFVEDEEPTPEDIVYKDKVYTVTGNTVRTNENGYMGSLVCFYFIDKSEIIRQKQMFDEKRPVVCSLIMDNYDEVVKSTPSANHGALLGDIERCIYAWVGSGSGISRRFERDKFIIVFENAEFEKLMANKFTILSEVKKIDWENKIPVTVSLGIGRGGEDIKECDKMARAALEMALGRGGDQAVVKTPNGLTFYGAKSREVEKSTRVKARVMAHALRELVDQSSEVIIMGHRFGDMDSFGASVGMLRAILDRGKEAYIAVDKSKHNAVNIIQMFTGDENYSNRILSGERTQNVIGDNTLLIVVDTHRPSMVEFPKLLKQVNATVLIDHHRRNEDFIENAVLTYHEPYASSASEMVTELLQYMRDGQRLSVKEAEALYCGIYMDTKGFTFKTGVRTFDAASFLRKMGVDPVNIRRLFRNDIGFYIQKSKIISHAQVYHGIVAIAICEGIGRDAQVVVAQAADDLLNIAGIEASFVLAKVGNRIMISGRSLDSINVQVILEKLGGGGHITIAGAQLENHSLTVAEAKLKEAIDEVMSEK